MILGQFNVLAVGFFLGLVSAAVFSISNIITKRAFINGQEPSLVLMSFAIPSALATVLNSIITSSYTNEVINLGCLVFIIKGLSNQFNYNIIKIAPLSLVAISSLISGIIGIFFSSIFLGVNVSIIEYWLSFCVILYSVFFLSKRKDKEIKIKIYGLILLLILIMSIGNMVFIYNGTVLTDVNEIIALMSFTYLGSLLSAIIEAKRKRLIISTIITKPSLVLITGVISPIASFLLLYGMNSYPSASIMTGVSMVTVFTIIGASIFNNEKLTRTQLKLLPLFLVLIILPNLFKTFLI